MPQEEIANDRQGDEQPEEHGFMFMVEKAECVVLIEISSVYFSQPNLSNDEQPDDGDCRDQKKRLSQLTLQSSHVWWASANSKGIGFGKTIQNAEEQRSFRANQVSLLVLSWSFKVPKP
jgi:hypothetical protein